MEKSAQESYDKHMTKRKNEIDKKEQSQALLDDMKELDDTVLNRKVSNAAEKMEVINTILDFAEKKGKEYPETPINMVFGNELKTLISETREKVFGDLQMDKAIKALEDGQKGTLFGKKDYDNVIKDLKELNEMYKTNKDAFLNNDKTAVTKEIKEKENKVLEGMEAYKRRKKEKFNNNRAAGKTDNANSRRRYNAMDKAMKDLIVRRDYNKRLENGFAPAAEPLMNEERQAQVPKVQAHHAAPGNRPVINKETVDYLRDLKTTAINARGIMHDSYQYLSFCAAIDNVTDVTVSILDSHKKGRIVDENVEYERYKKAVQNLKICAKDYEDYKLSDHTEDPQAEPNKKKLNSDDRTKLKIVRTVLNNHNRYFNTGEPVPDIVERRLKKAQDKIRSEKNKLGEAQFPDKDELKQQYADVAAANHIMTSRRHNEFKHVTEDIFEKVAESIEKMPAFRKAMYEGTDKGLYEHATNQKGQNFYDDIGRAKRSLNVAAEAQKENEQPVRSNIKILNKPDRTLGS